MFKYLVKVVDVGYFLEFYLKLFKAIFKANIIKSTILESKSVY